MPNETAALRVDGDRLWQSHLEMAEFGALPNGGCGRLSLTDDDKSARELFAHWCREAGATVQIDRAGNMFATRPGRQSGAPVATGSHLDTQPHGGRFDGVYGVLAGVEVLRTLHENGIETDLPVAVINWTNEEGVRFPAGMLGSSAYVGLWAQENLEKLVAPDGATFGEELRRIGYAGSLDLGAFPMTAFYEAHIEQGPILERENKTIGVVTDVQGLRWFEVTVEGYDSHAGTTPMDARRDSLTAAARMVVGLEGLGRTHAPDARVTVGRLDVSPNSGSTIPGKTTFAIDLRHPNSETLDTIEAAIGALCRAVAEECPVDIRMQRTIEMPPVAFDAGCIDDLETSTRALELPFLRMLSGALHDASPVSTRVPAAMLFVPCRNGLSHHEDEWAEPEHLEAGCNVLLHAMLRRAGC